ncbi:AmmeMemoRadiSam system protein A [Ferrigenium sp. UT5]|uniref:AmmeMemoRadiSam system protein A n=1 Tax=Ferrigenium sp. UT5 TaxID=3242105 RepID=UPI0035515C7B
MSIEGKVLLQLARAAISLRLGMTAELPPRADWLEKTGACFVTLKAHGQLRGCIGSLEARQALYDDVVHNAVAAAVRDPRFPPLTPAELNGIEVEVSLLSATTPMDCFDEADALAQLRPNVDGIILEYGPHRATFLPQVWADLPQPQRFLAHLKRKARLPEDFWSDDIRLARYTVQKFSEGK